MPGTFEPVDADAVDAEDLGFDRVADAGALVENLDACAVKVRQMGRGRRSSCLDDFHSAVDDHVAILIVGRRCDRREDCEVDPERLIGELARSGYFSGKIVRCRLCQGSEHAERAGVCNCRYEFCSPHPLHAALHDWVANSECLGKCGGQHWTSPRWCMAICLSVTLVQSQFRPERRIQRVDVVHSFKAGTCESSVRAIGGSAR